MERIIPVCQEALPNRNGKCNVILELNIYEAICCRNGDCMMAFQTVSCIALKCTQFKN